MRRASCFVLVLCLACATNAGEPKGVVVKLDKLTSMTPADWKSEKPKNRLRSHQFRIPGVKDAKDGEVFIFPDLTMTVEQNFARYMEQFVPPDGKTVEDIAKVEKFTVGKVKVAVLDMEGTWLYKDAAFDPKAKSEPRPNSRVVWAIFTSDDGNYLIRMSGPSATVNPQHKGFMEWIKGFK